MSLLLRRATCIPRKSVPQQSEMMDDRGAYFGSRFRFAREIQQSVDDRTLTHPVKLGIRAFTAGI